MSFASRSPVRGFCAPDRAVCRLLTLPVELQLVIYELALVDAEPLLLKCPCNSSYRERSEKHKAVEKDWREGIVHPPLQPALLRACRAIRELGLPIFYSKNVFRACYCRPWNRRDPMLPLPIKWLRMIGQRNRELLRHLYFYDRNEKYDWHMSALAKLKECEIFNELDGKMETLSTANCCAHLVWFGNWERKQGEIPVALQEGAKGLRIADEI